MSEAPLYWRRWVVGSAHVRTGLVLKTRLNRPSQWTRFCRGQLSFYENLAHRHVGAPLFWARARCSSASSPACVERRRHDANLHRQVLRRPKKNYTTRRMAFPHPDSRSVHPLPPPAAPPPLPARAQTWQQCGGLCIRSRPWPPRLPCFRV